MATQPIITRDTILKMISLLDFCYRLGVNHSYAQNDEGLARDFVSMHSATGIYGFLTDDTCNVGVLEWQLRLTKQARLTSMWGSMNEYFNRMGRFGTNYLSCFLNIAQDFYNRGVLAYYDAPHAGDIAQFNAARRVWWSPKGLLKVQPREYVEVIQLMCFDRKRRDMEYLEEHAEDYKAKKVALRPVHYDWFIRAAGLGLSAKKER